ncbi:MAG: hypothetical protein IKO26_06085 [Paludibacteraceae bacterium]|nr:hypothetical protein [Paludibacteraceae bacterium]
MIRRRIARMVVMLVQIAVLSGFIGCNKNYSNDPTSQGGDGNPPYESGVLESGSPRLVIRGHVENEAGEALSGIHVAVFGVRGGKEKDILSYNYALTDSAGQYTIIRYRGREVPAEVTVVATDSGGVYQEQVLFVPIVYDEKENNGNKEPYNGFATADFVLRRQ